MEITTTNSEIIKLSEFEDSKTLLKIVFEKLKGEMGEDHKDDDLKMVLSMPSLLDEYLTKFEELKESGMIESSDDSEKMPCDKTEEEAIQGLRSKAKRRMDFILQIGESALAKHIDDKLLMKLDEDTFKLLKPLSQALPKFDEKFANFIFENISILLNGGAEKIKTFLKIADNEVFVKDLKWSFIFRIDSQRTRMDFKRFLEVPNSFLIILTKLDAVRKAKAEGFSCEGNKFNMCFNIIGNIPEKHLEGFFESFMNKVDFEKDENEMDSLQLSKDELEEGKTTEKIALTDRERFIINIFNERSQEVIDRFLNLKNFSVFKAMSGFFESLTDEQIIAVVESGMSIETIKTLGKNLAKLDVEHIKEVNGMTFEEISKLTASEFRNYVKGKVPLKLVEHIKSKAEGVEEDL